MSIMGNFLIVLAALFFIAGDVDFWHSWSKILNIIGDCFLGLGALINILGLRQFVKIFSSLGKIDSKIKKG